MKIGEVMVLVLDPEEAIDTSLGGERERAREVRSSIPSSATIKQRARTGHFLK